MEEIGMQNIFSILRIILGEKNQKNLDILKGVCIS